MVERIPMKFVIVLAVLAICGLVSSIIEQPTDLTFLYSFGLLMLIGASFARIFPPKGIAKDRRRLTLFLLSASAMFAWPLSLFYGIHATLMLKSILEAQMLDYPLLPRLWFEVVFWMGLGPILPFVAAWLLRAPNKTSTPAASFAHCNFRVFGLGFFQKDVEVGKCIENGCVYGLAVACSHNVAPNCSHCCFCDAINAIKCESFLRLSN
jgi:hypothetical protein